jgi:ArsR family transcriptional regulator
LNVGDIASATHTHQSTISRNLTILRTAGVVTTQRDGNNILYQVANPKLMSVCDLMREVLIEQIGKQSQLVDFDLE